MELVARGSEYESFLTCRKQWLYKWILGLEPKRPDHKLFFGTLFHKWLEEYYKNKCNKLQADLETSVWLNQQNLQDMEQVELNETLSLFKSVAEHYHNTYGESDKRWKILGTEVKFLSKLDDDLFYTGTIDLVYEVDGKIRFADHKTVSSISMYEEKSKMDRQISRYWWVLEEFSAGRARILDETTETWKRWHVMEGKEIDGFDYNLIAKDYPKEPKVLKPKKGQTVGEISQDKSQKTTYALYLKKIQELGKSESDYMEFLSFLINKPEQFLKRVDVRRNKAELQSAMMEFAFTANDIHDIRVLLSEKPQMATQVSYRNIGTHCSTMCSFKDLCQTTIEGGNVKMIMDTKYNIKDKEGVK